MVKTVIMNPTVSVLIANYNGEAMLADCIDSVLAQEGKISVEIIIHDDASIDNSVNLLRDRYSSKKYPNIQLIESQENVGFCISNNRMAKKARGDYLLLLNNDAALAPNALEALIGEAKLQSLPGILGLPQIDWETGALVDRGSLLDPFYNPIPNLDPELRDVAMVIGACLWIPRLLWERIGGFPAWFESIAEDLQLCCQARLMGYPVQVVGTSYFRHRQGVSFSGTRTSSKNLSSTYRRRRLSERNKTYVMILCSPSLRLWLTLPIHLLLLAIEGMILSTIKRDRWLWQDIYANVFNSLRQNISFLLQERQRIQNMHNKNMTSYNSVFQFSCRKLQMLILHGLPSLS